MNLKKLQSVQIEILLEFDRVCKLHNLKYQLFGGTLLGAVRHKGMIPWDDDIDVCMPRDGYERFLKAAKLSLDEQFFLQYYEYDRLSVYNFSRIRKNGTKAYQPIWEDLDFHKGIFIDVFPLDNVSPDRLIGKFQKHALHFVKKIKPYKAKSSTNYGVRNKLHRAMKWLVHFCIKPISILNFNRFETRLATMFRNADTGYSSVLTDSTIYDCYDTCLRKNGKFEDTILMEFEGFHFPGPRNYDELLTRNYGDYLTYPPIEDRRPSHSIIKICFDTAQENDN